MEVFPNLRNRVCTNDSHSFIGKTIEKNVEGYLIPLKGKIVQANGSDFFYVRYENGVKEELSHDEAEFYISASSSQQEKNAVPMEQTTPKQQINQPNMKKQLNLVGSTMSKQIDENKFVKGRVAAFIASLEAFRIEFEDGTSELFNEGQVFENLVMTNKLLTLEKSTVEAESNSHMKNSQGNQMAAVCTSSERNTCSSSSLRKKSEQKVPHEIDIDDEEERENFVLKLTPRKKNHSSTKKIPEVIEIFDSDDEHDGSEELESFQYKPLRRPSDVSLDTFKSLDLRSQSPDVQVTSKRALKKRKGNAIKENLDFSNCGSGYSSFLDETNSYWLAHSDTNDHLNDRDFRSDEECYKILRQALIFILSFHPSKYYFSLRHSDIEDLEALHLFADSHGLDQLREILDIWLRKDRLDYSKFFLMLKILIAFPGLKKRYQLLDHSGIWGVIKSCRQECRSSDPSQRKCIALFRLLKKKWYLFQCFSQKKMALKTARRTAPHSKRKEPTCSDILGSALYTAAHTGSRKSKLVPDYVRRNENNNKTRFKARNCSTAQLQPLGRASNKIPAKIGSRYIKSTGRKPIKQTGRKPRFH